MCMYVFLQARMRARFFPIVVRNIFLTSNLQVGLKLVIVQLHAWNFRTSSGVVPAACHKILGMYFNIVGFRSFWNFSLQILAETLILFDKISTWSIRIVFMWFSLIWRYRHRCEPTSRCGYFHEIVYGSCACNLCNIVKTEWWGPIMLHTFLFWVFKTNQSK